MSLFKKIIGKVSNRPPCLCGCGEIPPPGCKWVHGHNLRVHHPSVRNYDHQKAYDWLEKHGYFELSKEEVKSEVFSNMPECFGHKNENPNCTICGDEGVTIRNKDGSEQVYRIECLCKFFTIWRNEVEQDGKSN